MELEDVHSDLCSLKKLYGLVQSSQDGLQMTSILDERARLLLKSLLDAATEKALSAYSKIIAAAQSGVSNTHYSSPSEQPKTMPYLEPPIAPKVVKASPSTIQSSNNAATDFCTNNPWKDEQSLVRPTPQDAGSELFKLSDVSSQKPESRMKRCRVCKRSSINLQNLALHLNEDGNDRDQQHDKAHWVNGDAKGWIKLKQKGLKSVVTSSEVRRHQRNCDVQLKPSIPSSVPIGSSLLGTGFAEPGHEILSVKAEKKQEDRGSNLSKEVNEIKHFESGNSSSFQLCSENVDRQKANNAVCHYELANGDNPVSYEMQPKDQGYFSSSRSEGNHAKRQNVKEIVQRIESFSRATSQNYQTHQHAQGFQFPPSQDNATKKSPVHSKKVRQHAQMRDPMAQLEIKSRQSMTLTPSSAGSVANSHKRNLPPRPFIRSTLLDYDEHRKGETPKRSYAGSWEESDETASSRFSPRSLEESDEAASSSANPHSSEEPYEAAASSSNPCSVEESYETASSRSSPRSSYSWTSQQQTSGSSHSSDGNAEPEDYYEPPGPPTRAMSRSKRYRSSSRKKKTAGRLRRMKNKLGLIFHHHHHHHHHVDNDSKKAHTKSMWKQLHRMFQHKDTKHDKAYYQKQAADKRRKAVVSSNKKQQAGHFHALVQGLMRHAKHSEKSKPSKGGIRRQLGHVQRGHDNKHWWKMFQHHGGGIKVPNKGHVKLGFTSKNKKLQLKAPKLR